MEMDIIQHVPFLVVYTRFAAIANALLLFLYCNFNWDLCPVSLPWGHQDKSWLWFNRSF